MRRKVEAQAEAKLWAKVQRAKYGKTQGFERTAISNQPEASHTDIVAVATKAEECNWMPDGLMDLDGHVQTVIDGFDSMNVKSNEVLENIEEAYNEDGANELSEDKL